MVLTQKMGDTAAARPAISVARFWRRVQGRIQVTSLSRLGGRSTAPSRGRVRPLHTHDASGVIHVESPTARRYTPGEVLRRVGVRFTSSCLGGYCAASDRRLRVFVDGRSVRGDPTALTLASHQEIVVACGTAAQLPSPVLSAYRFPPGL